MRKFDILAIQYLFSNKRKCSDAKAHLRTFFKKKKKKLADEVVNVLIRATRLDLEVLFKPALQSHTLYLLYYNS